MLNVFKNKILAVTGGTGSIGSELVKHLLVYKPKQIRIISRDDSRQYYLKEELNSPSNVRFLIGDIRDINRLDFGFQNVDIVFHAAALKHVPLCEYNPFEAIKTNIMGTQNVIEAALHNHVKKVIAISTDKAVNPTNIMGTSKLMMEKQFINANYYIGNAKTKFSCVRFGNVAWARGSVLPLWKKQADRDGVIKITNPEMTRFFMSINEAVQLVLQTVHLTKGGEIFILKMPSIKINDLAKLFVKKYYSNKPIKIKIIGKRPGEKKHEKLLDGSDQLKTIFENKTMLIVIPEIQIYGLRKLHYQYPHLRTNKKINSFCSKDYISTQKVNAII
ncbi:MAG: polysaccharide biosynthesis protein [Patescibacteria group bacterium]|nr:polysaccharide biosynthesis protein [Patescibacteria group bacterium]MDD5715141.1 polysaccharide biosynthesis protein [Patescibacteria group bacterium]